MDALTAYLEQNQDRFVDDLKAALRIPSVSARPEHKADCLRCAEHIAGHLKSLGMTRVEVVPTAGHPVVYAEWLGAPGRPTALLVRSYRRMPTYSGSAACDGSIAPRPIRAYASGRVDGFGL